MTIRIVIADDHPIVLSGLEQLFRSERDIEVVATATDGTEVLKAVVRQKPDVLLLDLHMPRKTGLDVLRELNDAASSVRVVLLTGQLSEDEVIEALRLNVRGVLLKEMAPRLLVECVRKVHAGGQWLEKASIGRAIEKMLKREEAVQQVSALLTRRELELLKLAAGELTTKEIAAHLFIAEGTVKIHLHSIYGKLGINNRVELKRLAREKGLV